MCIVNILAYEILILFNSITTLTLCNSPFPMEGLSNLIDNFTVLLVFFICLFLFVAFSLINSLFPYRLSFIMRPLAITKTRLYSFDPLKSHFYIVKLGFTGVYIIFLISAQKHRLWVLVRTASAIYVLSRNVKNIIAFYLKIFSFWR